jgi:SAM-dependent MidA family methyltransferase
MRDALRAARTVPAFLDAISVHLVEVSGPLRELQRQTLASSPRRRGSTPASGRHSESCMDSRLRGNDVAWHEALDDVPEGPAIVIANEFLDALPIRQLVFAGGAWRERVVEIDAHRKLRFAAGARVDGAEEGLDPPPQAGTVLELRAGEEELFGSLARRTSPLVALFIDYGPVEATVGDTLQAVRRHAYVDPLACPGSADLTSHVQFARLARTASNAGLAADGPMTQAEFLGRLGIGERGARLMAANPSRAGDIEAGVQRLISPTGMGQLFKAMAVRSPALPPCIPFV